MKYENYKSTLKEISKDTSSKTSPVFMVDFYDEVIDYDKFIEDYFLYSHCECKGPPPSVDGLCKIDDTWCFIEFKNGKINQKEKRGIHSKIGHSLLILLKNENIQISETCEDILFILVYNEEKNSGTILSPSEKYMKKFILDRANKQIIRYDLEKYKKIYFKDVFTFTQDEFKCFLSNHKITCPETNVG